MTILINLLNFRMDIIGHSATFGFILDFDEVGSFVMEWTLLDIPLPFDSQLATMTIVLNLLYFSIVVHIPLCDET